MNQQIVMDAVRDALQKVCPIVEMSGNSAWVDEDGKRCVVTIEFADEPKEAEEKPITYTVNLHVELAGAYEVEAKDEEDAEEQVKARFRDEDINLNDLALVSVSTCAAEQE